MTMRSTCSRCKEVAYHFEYNSPRLDPNNINDGVWLCDRHLSELRKDQAMARERFLELHRNNPNVRSLSRAERRASARKKKLF